MTVLQGTVLVADDNAVNRLILSRRLEQEGLAVVTANDGREALERLRAQAFDLVFLDIVMPEIDGYAVLAEVKADPELRHIPVIVVSALDEIESVARCIEAGAEDYLTKPFDPVLLRARINAGLAKKRLDDLEREYLEEVARVVAAAGAVEAGTFALADLDEVAARDDALGQLARVFQRMAAEVDAREKRLRQEVQQLRIEIDGRRATQRVAEITESDYFRALEAKVDELRLSTDS
jgi:CheY-like chemotaxis protein